MAPDDQLRAAVLAAGRTPRTPLCLTAPIVEPHNGFALHISAWDWRPGSEADDRRNGGFFTSAHWLRSYGRAGGEARKRLPASDWYANPAGSAHPIGVGWRFFDRF